MTAVIDVLNDAWRIFVPRRDDPHGPLSRLLVYLTVVTGLVDAFSYLVLGHVFVANATGNVVFLALALAGASGFSFSASLLALVSFSIGAIAGGRVIAQFGQHRGHLLAVATAIQTLFVAAATGIAFSASHLGSGAPRYLLIALLAIAMGIQNAAARKLAVPDLTTTVLTLTLTGIGADSRIAGQSGSHLGRRGMSIIAMFVGALIGAELIIGGHRPYDLLIAVISLALVATATTARSRSDPSWTRPAT